MKHVTILKQDFQGSEVNSVNSRDLHKNLGIKTDYSKWVKRAIDKYNFIENEDYIVIVKKVGRQLLNDYMVSLSMAKDITQKYAKLEIKDNHIEINKNSYNKDRIKSNAIYLITDGEYIKIGIATNNATSRLRQCQTGNPKKLWIDFEILVEDAFEIEKKLHEKYSSKRLIGEWFKLDKNDISDIKKELI